MKLQQLKFYAAVCDNNLNVTAAAKTLYTSQPGVSRQIRQLEEELGLSLFNREGKSLVSLTDAGHEILKKTKKILKEVSNIQSISQDLQQIKQGDLTIATTHTQARYVLPPVIKSFHQRFPSVNIHMHQGTSHQNLDMIKADNAEFTISSGGIEEAKGLVTLDCFKWQRFVVVPKDHSLAKTKALSLEKLSQYPLIVYVYNDQDTSSLVQALRSANLKYNIVFTARDSDVIKTYVRSGLGIGIIASMAFDLDEDHDLVALETKHILPLCSTWIAFKPDLYLSTYMREFIQLFAPHVTKEQIQSAINRQQARIDPQKIALPVHRMWHI